MAPAVLCLKSLPYLCWKLGCVFLILFKEDAENTWWLSQPLLQWVLLLHPSFFSLPWVRPLPSAFLSCLGVVCNSCFSPLNPLSLPSLIKVVVTVMGCGMWAEASQCRALTLMMDTQPEGDSPGATVPHNVPFAQPSIWPQDFLVSSTEREFRGHFARCLWSGGWWGQWQDVAQGLLPSSAVWLLWGPGDTSEGSGWSPSPPGYCLSWEFYCGVLPTL